MNEEARAAKANAVGEKARLKAMRPWYKKKRVLIPAAIILIAIAANAGGGGGDKAKAPTAGAPSEAGSTEATARLYPDRPDSQSKDVEAAIGQPATLGGYQATVTSAGFQQSVNDFEKDGYIVAEVTIKNLDKKAQSFNYFDWKIQTSAGQVLDAGITGSDGTLSSGDLVAGGSVSGKIIFETKDQKGVFYIIYKPNAFSSARGIWKVTR